MSNQSGLSTGYTGGMTNYATYVASDPTHDFSTSISWSTAVSSATMGSIIFDLGGDYNVTHFLFWNQRSSLTSHVASFSIELDDNAGFTSPVTALAATPTRSDAALPVSGESFVLTNSQDACYVRFNILANGGSSTVTIFSEVAFGGTAVPEPSSYAVIAGACALGLLVFRRRRA